MARFYRYANSNDKSGYFLWGRSKGSNYTLQVETLAAELLKELEFNPGIANKERGDKIPNDLEWALYKAGLLDTGDLDASEKEEAEKNIGTVGESVDLTKDMRSHIQNLLDQNNYSTAEFQELAEILDLEIQDKEAIWELSGERLDSVDGYIVDSLAGLVNDNRDWTINANASIETIDEVHKAVLKIELDHIQDDSNHFYHIIYFCSEHGLETISTAGSEEMTWRDRRRIEKQRAWIMDAIISMRDDLSLYIGEPDTGIFHRADEELDIFN